MTKPLITQANITKDVHVLKLYFQELQLDFSLTFSSSKQTKQSTV